jgi:tight adherence protein B
MTWRGKTVGLLLAGVTASSLLAAQAGTASARTLSPAPGAPRVTMIVLDMSKALTGIQTEAERRAALRYAQALPPDVRVGLVTFSTQWGMALHPTGDRGALEVALNASHRSGESSAAGLYDAMTAAQAAALSGARDSRLLVLSEGEDVPSAAFRPAIPVDVMTWHNDADDNIAALDTLADTSGGHHLAAPGDAAALAAAVPAMAPASSPGASAAAGSQGSASSGIRAISGTRAASPGTWSWPLILGLGGVFLALLLALLLLTGALRGGDRARRLERQLDRHYRARREGPPEVDGEDKVAGAVVGWVAGLLSDSLEERLALRLDHAGIARKPAEWIVLVAAADLVLAVVLSLLTGNPLAGVLLGMLAGWLGARLIVSWRIARRRAAFADQLPDVLQLVAGSLQSGFSLPQALGAVVREDSQPAAGEFSRALAETRIGADLEVALDRVADRMDSTDLRWAVMAIRIQRTVGGNLVEVLRTTVVTMRERAQLRRHVRALSAEGRLSAYILLALPLVIGGWLLLTRRSYVHPLYSTPFGLVMLIGAAVLMVLGSLWMRSLIKVEV